MDFFAKFIAVDDTGIGMLLHKDQLQAFCQANMLLLRSGCLAAYIIVKLLEAYLII